MLTCLRCGANVSVIVLSIAVDCEQRKARAARPCPVEADVGRPCNRYHDFHQLALRVCGAGGDARSVGGRQRQRGVDNACNCVFHGMLRRPCGLIAYTVTKDRECDVVFQHFASLVGTANGDDDAMRKGVGTVSRDRTLAEAEVARNFE